MRFLIVLLVGMAIASSLAWSVVRHDTCEHSPTSFQCVRYIRNYDADTITVEIPAVHPLIGKAISVRVRGIDTAEIRGKAPCEKDAARWSKRFVEKELKRAKRIDLVNVDRDKYFRILADVQIDGRSLGELLLKNKLAVAYDGGTKSTPNWCQMKERQPASPQAKDKRAK